MRRIIAICVVALWASCSAHAQQKPLKVYISADMEGIGGVSTWQIQASPPGREYEKFRRLMTLEVNAAVQGAIDAGATEVLVGDSHGDGQNIDVELLDSRAHLVRAWPGRWEWSGASTARSPRWFLSATMPVKASRPLPCRTPSFPARFSRSS